MHVLVTGAGGLLGGRLASILQERGFRVSAVHRHAAPPRGLHSIPLDLLDTGGLARALDRQQPSAVVHAAALARVDDCCQDPEEAQAVNARLPGTLARLCRERALRLVALSTDLVFSGEGAPFREDATPRPLSAYARSKLAGEEAVLEACPEAAVVRVPLVLGRGHGARGSASESIAWALRAGRPMVLFTDEHRTPLDPESIADAVGRLLRSAAGGRFHLGGPERLSRLELGRRVARVLGLHDAGLIAVRQADAPAPEPRSADASLDATRARLELAWEPRPLDTALREGRPFPP